MATFQVAVADPESGRTYQREVDGQDANRFLGLEVGDEVDGDAVELDGYTVEITGGSDAAGRPMRPDVDGPALKDVLLSGGPGFNPSTDGERKRVSVRGKEVSDAIVQLNVSVAERGDPSVAVLYGEEEPEDVEEDEPDAESDEDADADEAADEESEDEAAEESEADAEEDSEDEDADADEAEESEADDEATDDSEADDAEEEDAGEDEDEAETDEDDEEDATDDDEE